jgi:hypothetical protein
VPIASGDSWRGLQDVLNRRDQSMAPSRLFDKNIPLVRLLRHAAGDHIWDTSIREFAAEILAVIAQYEVQHRGRYLSGAHRLQRLSARSRWDHTRTSILKGPMNILRHQRLILNDEDSASLKTGHDR